MRRSSELLLRKYPRGKDPEARSRQRNSTDAVGLLHEGHVSSKEFVGGDSAARTALHMAHALDRDIRNSWPDISGEDISAHVTRNEARGRASRRPI